MRLIDEVSVVLFSRLLVLLQNTLLYKFHISLVILTGLCLCMNESLFILSHTTFLNEKSDWLHVYEIYTHLFNFNP